MLFEKQSMFNLNFTQLHFNHYITLYQLCQTEVFCGNLIKLHKKSKNQLADVMQNKETKKFFKNILTNTVSYGKLTKAG